MTDRPPNQQPDDPVLVLQAIYPRLHSMAVALGGRGHADDLVQEALVQVLTRYPQFTGVRAPLAYSKTVLARLVYRSRKGAEVPSAAVDAMNPATDADFTDDIVLRSVVLGAIDGLPPRQRACVYLRYVEGLSDAQIGKILGCRGVTVRTQTSRALRRLRPELENAGVTNV
jgi:RNA polymerase sigma factor (sigma-70 family)